MIGKVKFYNEQKGYGFINSDQGNEYFFHITAVVEKKTLNKGDEVSFEVKEQKGKKFASNITLERENVAKFITIDNVRIKLSNIKNYGIAYEKVYYEKHYHDQYPNTEPGVKGFFKSIIAQPTEVFDHYIRNGGTGEQKNLPYLYITTYQGDNYQFREPKSTRRLPKNISNIEDICLKYVQKRITKLDSFFNSL